MLVDQGGKPLAKYKVYLSGDELYPATSVLSSAETDEEGRFEIREVPLKSYYFSLSARRAEYKTRSIVFERAEHGRFRLVYDDIAGTLVVERQK